MFTERWGVFKVIVEKKFMKHERSVVRMALWLEWTPVFTPQLDDGLVISIGICKDTSLHNIAP